jgi:hypothetical protein
MALFWRVWAAVSAVNLVVLAIFVGLATLQFGEIHSALVGARLVVLLDRTAAPFSAAARINLPLSSVRNAGALLERARQTDDLIAAIHVFDVDGRVIHSTEAPPPAAIPPLAMAARARAAGRPWHRETAVGFLGGVDISGIGGRSAGGILIVYPVAGKDTHVRAMAAELALAAIVLLALTSALSGLLLRIGMRKQIASFEAVDQAIGDFERDSWRSAAGGERSRDAADEAGELRRLLDMADSKYRAMGRAIAAAAKETPR